MFRKSKPSGVGGLPAPQGISRPEAPHSRASPRPATPPPLTREQIRSMLDNTQRLRALHDQERGRGKPPKER